MDHTLPCDEDITKILFGCWSGIEITHGNPMQYLTWYKKDMTLVSKGQLQTGGQNIEFTTEGKWRVEGGKLINHVTKSTIESIVGQDLTNAFKAADHNTTVFVSSEDALVTNVREDADNPDEDFHDRLVARSLQVMIEFQTTARGDYAKWLADDVVLVDRPNSLFNAKTSSGLDAVVDHILGQNQLYTHDFQVQRVTRQDPVQVFELSDTWTAGAKWLRLETDTKLDAPTCSIYEFKDHKIVNQINYVALAPDPGHGS